MNTYTLDSAGWPLIINRGDEVVATFPLPEGSTGDDVSGLLQLARATDIAGYLNGCEQRRAAPTQEQRQRQQLVKDHDASCSGTLQPPVLDNGLWICDVCSFAVERKGGAA